LISINLQFISLIFVDKIITMNLTNLPIGTTATVVAVNGNNAITRRLMEMGIVPGVLVRVVKSAPFGDPLEIRVRGYNLAMRKSEADSIEVDSNS
jgi:ferrous iron transport protein A